MKKVEEQELEPCKEEHIWKGKLDKKFYFSDESEGLNGPFNTLEKAKKSLELYVKFLNWFDGKE